MDIKKTIAREWLLLLISLLTGHFVLALIVVITDSRATLANYYGDLAEYPITFVIAGISLYALILLIRSVIWSIKTVRSKNKTV